MNLLREMLTALLYSILPSGVAFLLVTIIVSLVTDVRNFTLIPSIIAAALVFLLVYSYFLASSNYALKDKHKELEELQKKKIALEHEVDHLTAKADAARRSANQATKKAWQKLDSERFAFELEKQEHYQKLRLKNETSTEDAQ